MSQRDLNRYTALSTADVHETFVIGPRELKCQRLGDAHAEAGHGGQELLQSGGGGVNRGKNVFPSFSLVLRLAGFEARGAVAPGTGKAVVGHFPSPPALARLRPGKEPIAFGRDGEPAL